MTTYLLDVNLLLALSDPMHAHHEIAHQWFGANCRLSWATCPLTENGFVRIASHPQYPNRPGDTGVVLNILRQFCATPGHVFWVEDVSISNLVLPGAVITHNHVTDVYLLGLAIHKGGKLAAFDQHIPVTAVAGGVDALELVQP